jgi:glycosyltransferase involved in cell wall biosynthesis
MTRPLAGTLLYVAGKDPLLEVGGGHSAFVRAHARAACRIGFEPEIFCASPETGVVPTDFGRVRRIRSLWPMKLAPNLGSPTYLSLAPLHVPQLAHAIRRRLALRREGPVLLHGFGVWGSAAVAAARRDERSKTETRVVVSCYTTLDHETRAKIAGARKVGGLRRRLPLLVERCVASSLGAAHERRAVRGADRVLVNYDAVARLLTETYGEGVAWRRIPYTSESSLEDAEPRRDFEAPPAIRSLLPGDAPLVMALSRHDPRKGIDVLLTALAALRSRGVAFRAVLVGGGPLLSSHRELAARLGLSDHAALTGFVPDPRPYFRQADIFVLPSREEGSGSLSMIEALREGVPVVASACDGIPEDVTDGESALLVPPGDSDALGRAISALLRSRESRVALARAGRRIYDERFSPERFVAALAKTYSDFGLDAMA